MRNVTAVSLYVLPTPLKMILRFNKNRIIYDFYLEVPSLLRDILYLTAVLNSSVNPIIYGLYFYREDRNRHMQANTTR